jgi:hypothetical protein
LEQSCVAARLTVPPTTLACMGAMHADVAPDDGASHPTPSPGSGSIPSHRPQMERLASTNGQAADGKFDQRTSRAAVQDTVRALSGRLAAALCSDSVLDSAADAQAQKLLAARLPPAGLPPRPQPPLDTLPDGVRLRCAVCHRCSFCLLLVLLSRRVCGCVCVYRTMHVVAL